MKLNSDSLSYGACSFELNGKKVRHRASKITPAKIGQFVTIWKRSSTSITEPFHVNDDLDFIMITVRSGENFGQFIPPKSVLVDKGIIAQVGKDGKRGIRVYPPWDIAKNKRAQKTQSWQTKYFLTLRNDKVIDLELSKKLLSMLQ